MKHYCKLCGTELTKQNKCSAHIIPEFIWREYMINENNKKEDMILLRKNNQPPRFLRKYGITDDDILCRDCDDEVLGKYENGFREVWNRVFKKGKIYPVEKNDKLYGWAKEIRCSEDIIKTKLFILCCIWRASISSSEYYPFKVNRRKEEAIKKILTSKNHEKLLYSYETICSKFEDLDFSFASAPFSEKIRSRKINLVRLYLPNGYLFSVRLGLEPIDAKIKPAVFGSMKNAFFIANMGKMEGSSTEGYFMSKTLKALRNMYSGDKEKVKNNLLEKYDDLTGKDINVALKI